MKKETLPFIMFLLVFAGALSFTSCEENDEIKIPAVYHMYNVESPFWHYVVNGETLKLLGWSIDETKSSKGLHIDLVKYYFDGELIESSTSSPFALNYPIKNMSIGEHELKVYLEVSGKGYANVKVTKLYPVYVLEEPFALDYDTYFDNDYEADKVTVSNGETLSGHTVPSEDNTIDATITKVEYYWDDNLFGASSIAPYNFSYPVNNEKAGKHNFKTVVTTNTEYGEFTITGEQVVVVK